MLQRSNVIYFIAGLLAFMAGAGVVRLWRGGDAFTAVALAILAGAGILAWVVVKAIRVELIEGDPLATEACPACGHKFVPDISTASVGISRPGHVGQGTAFYNDFPETGITRAEAVAAFEKKPPVEHRGSRRVNQPNRTCPVCKTTLRPRFHRRRLSNSSEWWECDGCGYHTEPTPIERSTP